ncbi:uncharacterized protein [Montipora foliosa]|uniref:uncharacterized protein n=1 Tax=Montipora foliosa TaxID=591990 RepID=UPI0035F1682A
MDKVLPARQPPEQSQVALSRASKIFFGCDIFQVIAVVVFQSSMIAFGDFSAYNNTEHPGMGPGRRIYMAIYMGSVVYTSFLCLFAVKRQNFMEIVAFDLQNFGFVAYSFIQFYHVGFKKYKGLRISENDVLPKIVIANAMTLLLLNVVFVYLSYKLYIEFGWKIYKRVRFNNKLRGVYQVYELLSCLLKMEILYSIMFGICHSLVLLRDTQNVFYYLSLSLIPLSFLYAAFGFYVIRRENRCLMIIFLSWTLTVIGYFFYKLYGFVTRTCIGCKEFEENGKDIPQEAFMHFVYLGTINVVVSIAILGVALKAFLNFGKGLAEHFKHKKKPQFTLQGLYDLGLGRSSHLYPEESVVSVTSYEFDEFGESVRLDRDVLHPLHPVDLREVNGRNLAGKRSCSLPNLLTELPHRTNLLHVSGDVKKSLLNARQLESRPDSGNRVITSSSEEKLIEDCRGRSCSSREKRVTEAKVHRYFKENTDEIVPSGCMTSLQSPSKSNNVTVNIHVNGCADKRLDDGKRFSTKDETLMPERKANGHVTSKERLKSVPETEIKKACVIQTSKCNCEDNNHFSTKNQPQGVINGEKAHLQNQSTAGTVHCDKFCTNNDGVLV